MVSARENKLFFVYFYLLFKKKYIIKTNKYLKTTKMVNFESHPLKLALLYSNMDYLDCFDSQCLGHSRNSKLFIH